MEREELAIRTYLDVFLVSTMARSWQDSLTNLVCFLSRCIKFRFTGKCHTAVNLKNRLLHLTYK